ncbi:F420-dependent oxidoreductase [Mumia zhuanghuii]|uniref:Pr6Pr family membrane protein n=2 Tax=Mumia TaxID=1546255 RepID=A0ABW1QGB2_9ACTN|nr:MULTISPECIES: Pr6Pr family membrane protein [Mumia]KAA1422733.1 F420-dependent oxidoreductase [Mumia zhuanghuii]
MSEQAAVRSATPVRVAFTALAVLGAWAVVGQAIQSVSEGRSLVNYFSYFTIQSNLLVLITAVAVAVRGRLEGWWQPAYVAGVVGIVITGVVFHLLLAGQQTLEGISVWYDLVLHTLVPIGAVAGFLLLRPRLDRRAWWFLVWPVAWAAYTLVRGAIADPRFPGPEGEAPMPVPYDFLDADSLGYGQVALTLTVIAVFTLVIGGAVIGISRRIAR